MPRPPRRPRDRRPDEAAGGGRAHAWRAQGHDATIRGELTAFDEQVSAAEHELDAGRSDELADLLLRVETAVQRAAALTSVVNERRRSAVAELAAAIDETVVASLEADSARIAAELAAVEAEASTLIARAAEVTAAEKELAATPEPSSATISPVDAASALAEAQGERAALAASLHTADAAWEETERRAATLASEHQLLENERVGFDDAVTAAAEAARLAAERASAAVVFAGRGRALRVCARAHPVLPGGGAAAAERADVPARRP